MYELGKLYLNHKCGADSEQALMWFTVGAKSGSIDCNSEAEKLTRTLSASATKRAQLAADKWIRSNPSAEEDDDAEEKH